MKIAFWSMVAGAGGTSSNLAGTAVITSMAYRYRTLIMQSSYGYKTLDDSLIYPKSNVIKEEFACYSPGGIDRILKKCGQGELDVETVKQSTVRLQKENVYYIPSTIRHNKEIYMEAMTAYITNILEKAEKFADLLFVDSGSGMNEITRQILETADMIVVNFNQDSRFIDQFFESYYQFSEKSVYLIGSYDSDSNYNIRNIHRIYRIPKDSMAIIPYNTGFGDAFCEGRIVTFLKKNYSCRNFDKNYYFIEGLKKASSMILKKAGLLV